MARRGLRAARAAPMPLPGQPAPRTRGATATARNDDDGDDDGDGDGEERRRGAGARLFPSGTYVASGRTSTRQQSLLRGQQVVSVALQRGRERAPRSVMVQPAIAQQRAVLSTADGVGAPSAGVRRGFGGEAPNVTGCSPCPARLRLPAASILPACDDQQPLACQVAAPSSPCPRSVAFCGTSVTVGGSRYRARSELCERSKRTAESPSQSPWAALAFTSTCSDARAACDEQQPLPCQVATPSSIYPSSLRRPAASALPACGSQQPLPAQLATASSPHASRLR